LLLSLPRGANLFDLGKRDDKLFAWGAVSLCVGLTLKLPSGVDEIAFVELVGNSRGLGAPDLNADPPRGPINPAAISLSIAALLHCHSELTFLFARLKRFQLWICAKAPCGLNCGAHGLSAGSWVFS
jgi:hypothetical protein